MSETTGAPGFAYDFYYYGVPVTAYNITINGYYEGNPAHNVKIQQYNFTTTAWTNLSPDANDFPSSSVDGSYTFSLYGGVNYVQSVEVRISVTHTSAGAPTHNFYVDEMKMGEIPSIHVNEDITLRDAGAGYVGIDLTAAETIAVADAASLAPVAIDITALDAVAVAESTTVAVLEVGAIAVTVTDAASIAEAVALALNDLLITASDAININDAVSASSEELPPTLSIAITPNSVFAVGVRIVG